jgi:hypothetical protein
MPEAAAATARQLTAAGFYVTQELYGSYHRVIVPNVPAAMVYAAIVKLGSLGIEEVWVRE